MYNDPIIALLLAFLRGVVFILLIYGMIGIFHFTSGLLKAIQNGEKHYVTSFISGLFRKIKAFRIKSMGQRIALTVLVLSGITVLTIAFNKPSYKHYGDGFWLSFSLMILSLICLFGWFSLVMPFSKWIKTGEVPDWVHSFKKLMKEVDDLAKNEPRMVSRPVKDKIFPRGTKFYDVQGVPATFQMNILGFPVCNAWDAFPPREIIHEDILQNGKEISREIFDEMVRRYMP